jgi:hypothetical protein
MNDRLTALALAAGLSCSGAALAQQGPGPYYVGIAQDVTHESNTLNSSAGSEVSDTIYTTTLRGGLNLPFGRQRVFANAELSHQTYSKFDVRDTDGYNLGAGLDWSTIERLSGNFTFNAYRRQAAFNVGGITLLTPPPLANIERSEDLNARVRLGVVTTLAFEAGVGHRRVDFSAPEFAAREYQQDSGNLGVSYRPSGILTLGAGFSGQRTRFRVAELGQTEPDRSRRQDVYVTANWVPTGASTVDARLNIGKTEYDLATAADFDGVTGSLTWAWRPTGRLSLATTVSRDTGQETGFLRLLDGSRFSATNFSRVTDSLSLRAEYMLTGKVSLTGGLGYAQRDLVDGFTGVTGSDNTTTLSLGARWAATRSLAFGCSASRDSRSASGSGSSEYDNDRIGCFGQFTLD